ncbi:MAG: hypothetical protein WBB01_23825 [Phormidesmis sp.]
MREKSTKRPLVESVFDEVEELRQTYRFDDIVAETITKHKLDIKPKTFLYHYYRIKRDRAEAKQQAESEQEGKRSPAVPSPTKIDATRSNTVEGHTAASRVDAIFRANREKKG